MKRGGVFIGDVLELIEKLVPDESALQGLLALVGVAPPSAIEAEHPPKPQGGEIPDVAAAQTATPERESKQPPREDRPLAVRPHRVVRMNRPPQEKEEFAWLKDGERLSAQSPKPKEMRRPDPLFAPEAERAILTLTASTFSPDGIIDLRMLIQTISSCRPVLRIPRAWRHTVRHGVQVLVDRGNEMVPFRLDCDALVERIRAVVGHSRTSDLTFVGTPLRSEEPRWDPPAPGTAIVLLSALGAGGPLMNPDRAMPEEWARFAHRAQAAGCPLVALSPHPAWRYPTSLRSGIPILRWDRPTSARAAQRAVFGRGRR